MMSQTRSQETPYILKPEYEQSLKSQPDIVIILLGTNDASDDDTNRGNPALIDTYYKQCALDMIKSLSGARKQSRGLYRHLGDLLQTHRSAR